MSKSTSPSIPALAARYGPKHDREVEGAVAAAVRDIAGLHLAPLP